MKKQYGLHEIYQVEADPDFERELSDTLGERSAKVFDEFYRERGSLNVSIGGGRVIYSLVSTLQAGNSRNIRVTPTTLMTRSLIRGKIYDSPYLAIIAHWKSIGLSEATVCTCPPIPTEREPRKGESAQARNHRLMAYGKRLQPYFDCLTYIVENNPEASLSLEKSMGAELVFLGISGFGESDKYSTWDFYEDLGIRREDLKDESLRAVAHCNYGLLNEDGADLSEEVTELIKKKLGIKASRMPKGSHPLVPAASSD